jgi:hypothetical protein
MLTDRQTVVHAKMLSLIGVTYRGENQRITVPPIPDGPLVIPPTNAASANPEATSDDGVPQSVEIWTPDWRKGLTFEYNDKFMERVMLSIVADERHLEPERVSEMFTLERGRRLICLYSACSCP